MKGKNILNEILEFIQTAVFAYFATFCPLIPVFCLLSATRCTLYAVKETLYNSREHSTNSPFLCKTNPIFLYFHPKTKISLKNKPNSKPIQTQFWLKNKGGKPKQTQFILSICDGKPAIEALRLRIFELTKRGKKDIIRFFKVMFGGGLKLPINNRHR